MKEKEEKIQHLATCIHDSVNQHYDIYPYSYHLNMVANFAKKYINFFDEEFHLVILFGAYFHDSIEDARLTYNDVMKHAKTFFDDEKAYLATEIVYALTNEKGRTRAERANDNYYKGIRETPFASYIKLCDRMANLTYSKMSRSRMHIRYIKEWEHFIDAITNSENADIKFHFPNDMKEEAISLLKDNEDE